MLLGHGAKKGKAENWRGEVRALKGKGGEHNLYKRGEHKSQENARKHKFEVQAEVENFRSPVQKAKI